MAGSTANVGHTVIPFLVRGSIEHFHTLQTWRSDMHGHRNWCRTVHLHPISRLVRTIPVHYIRIRDLTDRMMHRYLIWIGESSVDTNNRRFAHGLVCLPRLSAYPGSDQEKTFGPTISGLIHRHIGPERLLLWDSKLLGGRPDTMKIVKEAYHSWGAEGRSHYQPAFLELCTSSQLLR